MERIEADGYSVIFGDAGLVELNHYLIENKDNISKIYILADSNTEECCIQTLYQHLPTLANDAELIVVEPGEENKTIETSVGIWNYLSETGADRKSLLINLGGGVITDMGGFCAANFKRGIRFINIPTTLLSQVDASVGGKTGVDLGGLKNQIGAFANPEMVIVNTEFLTTLDSRQLISGLAEMYKHGLIADVEHWIDLVNEEELSFDKLQSYIAHSVSIKNNVVKQDWKEGGLRKILNFGHTAGHAIETFFLNSDDKENLTHGEAIAAGMVIESWISNEVYTLEENFPKNLKIFMTGMYGKIEWTPGEQDQIIELMKHDKKNSNSKINFSLLRSVGDCSFDDHIDVSYITAAMNFYQS